MSKRKSFSIGSSLSKGLTDTVTAARNYSGNLHVEVIPIRKIELDIDNPRELLIGIEEVTHGLKDNDPLYEKKKAEIDSLQSLSSSIKNQGIINPVTVYKYGESYKVVAGERRTLASILAEKQDIPARILPQKPSAFDLSVLQWVENMEREDLSLWERLSNLEKISAAFSEQQGKKETSVTELSQITGCSLAQASHYKTLLYGSKNLKEAIKNNDVKNIEKAAFIAKAPSQFEKQLIELCKKGSSLDALKKSLSGFQKSKSKGEIGRQAKQVNFGTTKNISVSKAIIEAVLSKPEYSTVIDVSNVRWEDYKSVTKAFYNLIASLEKLLK